MYIAETQTQVIDHLSITKMVKGNIYMYFFLFCRSHTHGRPKKKEPAEVKEWVQPPMLEGVKHDTKEYSLFLGAVRYSSTTSCKVNTQTCECSLT